MAETRRGFGVAAAVAPEVTRAAAAEAEARGYDSFWVNDNTRGDGLVALSEAAQVTDTIALGVGVIALSRRDPRTIVARVRGETQADEALPLNRLLLGVGSGAGGPGALARVRDGVQALREELDATIYISALGPKMSRLAGEVADGVLFNWLTPEYARKSVEWVLAGAAAAGRKPPVLAAYVRVALGPDAAPRLTEEGSRYARIPAYADHFQRMGVAPVDTCIAGASAEAIQEALTAWDGILDLVVVRAITPRDTVDETLALVRAAAPQRVG